MITYEAFRPSEAVTPDPAETLIGTCQTCKGSATCKRGDARTKGNEWEDVPATGCPSCGAVIYLHSQSKDAKEAVGTATAELETLRVELSKAKAMIKRLVALLHARDADVAKLKKELDAAKVEPEPLAPQNPTFGKMIAALRAEADAADWTEADDAVLGDMEAEKLPPVPAGFDWEED